MAGLEKLAVKISDQVLKNEMGINVHAYFGSQVDDRYRNEMVQYFMMASDGGAAVIDRPISKSKTSSGGGGGGDDNGGDGGGDGGNNNGRGGGGGGGSGGGSGSGRGGKNDGNSGSNGPEKKRISSDEKFTTIGTMSKSMLRQILPKQQIQKMEANPMIYLRNI